MSSQKHLPARALPRHLSGVGFLETVCVAIGLEFRDARRHEVRSRRTGREEKGAITRTRRTKRGAFRFEAIPTENRVAARPRMQTAPSVPDGVAKSSASGQELERDTLKSMSMRFIDRNDPARS